MLEGTLNGLQRLNNFLAIKRKKRLWTMRDVYNNLRYDVKKWYANRVEHVDISYLSLWAREDWPYISREYRKIALGEILPDQITRKIQRYYNDQSVYYETGFRKFEPLQVTKKVDQILDEYLTYLMRLHIGQTRATMSYISIGTDGRAPDRTDVNLYAQVRRYHILSSGGYIDFLGHNELYGLITPFTDPTIVCAESGLHTAKDPNADKTACRNTYSPAITHTQNQDALGVNIVIQHRAF